MRSLVIALALTTTTAACGPEETGWTGIYMIDTWTENTAGCGDPGVSIREMQTDTHFYIENDEFFTAAVVVAEMCTSLEECQMLQPEDVPLFSAFALFDKGSDGDGWTGRLASSSPGETECSGTEVLTTMNDDATGIVFRQERTDVTYPFSGSSDPAERCPPERVYDAAEDAPCNELEIVHGVFLQDL